MAPSTSAKPTGWPATVEFLGAPRVSKKLSSEKRYALTRAASSVDKVVAIRPGACVNVRIRAIDDSKHPAHGQHGLYAAHHLPPDSLILQYLGFVHGEADTDPASDYDLSLDREHGIGVDATHTGNEARFINDYRGVAAAPNAEFRDVWIDIGAGRVEKRMGVYVLGAGKSGKRAKGIAKGEEILVSYGKGFWSERLSAGDGAS